MSKTQTIARALAPAIAIAAAVTCGGGAAAASLTEGFDDVVLLFSRPAAELPWTQNNNSTAIGDNPDWIQGGSPFDAHADDPIVGPDVPAQLSYISADYESTANTNGVDTISNWLIAPTLIFNNGDVVSFWTRTVDLTSSVYPERLQLRFSNVGGTNVGTSPTDVGSFTALLLDINPNYSKTVYPHDWAEYTSTITGLSGPTNGAIAFRYFVEDGGPGGLRSNYIGIDSVSITPGVSIPVPEPAAYLMMALGLGVIGLRRMRGMRG